MTDDLARRLARDLDGSFAELVEAHERLLFSLALRMTASRQDAEEIAQDAFVRAYEALASYPAERVAAMHLRPWLAQIALNAARSRLRRRRLATQPLDDQIDLAVPADEEPEAKLERRLDRQEWTRLLAGLPVRYREAVMLRHVEDLSYVEAAEALGLPVGTVKTHVHRGVRLLRQAVEARRAPARTV